MLQLGTEIYGYVNGRNEVLYCSQGKKYKTGLFVHIQMSASMYIKTTVNLRLLISSLSLSSNGDVGQNNCLCSADIEHLSSTCLTVILPIRKLHTSVPVDKTCNMKIFRKLHLSVSVDKTCNMNTFRKLIHHISGQDL